MRKNPRDKKFCEGYVFDMAIALFDRSTWVGMGCYSYPTTFMKEKKDRIKYTDRVKKTDTVRVEKKKWRTKDTMVIHTSEWAKNKRVIFSLKSVFLACPDYYYNIGMNFC